nr:hypothetical protein [uncultured Campylobacter sp.]
MRLLNSIYDEASGIKKVKSSKFADKFIRTTLAKTKDHATLRQIYALSYQHCKNEIKAYRVVEISRSFAGIGGCALNFRLKYAKIKPGQI